MLTLENPPYEVLAHARGKGAPLNDADQWAGFAPHRRQVVGRIAELRAAQTLAKDTPAKAADRGKISEYFSRLAGVKIKVADPVDA